MNTLGSLGHIVNDVMTKNQPKQSNFESGRKRGCREQIFGFADIYRAFEPEKKIAAELFAVNNHQPLRRKIVALKLQCTYLDSLILIY